MGPDEDGGPGDGRTDGQVGDGEGRVAPVADVERAPVGEGGVGGVPRGHRATPLECGGVDEVDRIAQVADHGHQTLPLQEREAGGVELRAGIGERHAVPDPRRAALPREAIHPVGRAAARPHGVAPVPTRTRQAEPRRRQRHVPHDVSPHGVDAHQTVLAGAVTGDLSERLQAQPAYRSFLLDGQTVLVEDYLRACPDREGDLRTLVKTGRLQVGPWYVLPDEQIPSGEGLVRNLLLGAADAERLGGRLDVLYSPDAFGHPAAWPTLAREFGMRYGVVWRGLGGETGQERDLYRWRGLDDKEVLLWHLPRAGYEIGAALPADAEQLFAAWAPVRGALVQRATGKHVPVFIGADHHGAHPDVPRLRDLLAELDPQSAFRVSRLDEFFQAAADGAKPSPLAGELRWSYRYAWTLQGVHGTRAPLKRRYSAAELALARVAEPLAALARRAGGRDRRPVLELAWRALVRCQFHDAIAGCAADDVARAVESRLTSVEALSGEVVRGSVHDLVHHDPDAARGRAASPSPTLVIWNPAARPRRGVMIADVTLFRRDVLVGPRGDRVPREGQGYRPFALATSDGHTVPVQLLDRRIGTERLDAAHHYPDQDEVDEVRIAFRSPTVPGLGLASAGLAAGATGARGTRPPGEGALVKGRPPVRSEK